MEAKQAYEKLVGRLGEYSRVAVAFSGGVDSALLLKACKDALGKNVLAFTAKSPFFPQWEGQEAEAFCNELGVEQRILRLEPLKFPEIADNPPERCYYCKRLLFSAMKEEAQKADAVLLEGTNLDDLGDYRPGLRAIEELKIVSPLKELGFTKKDVREISRYAGLATADKPSYACLASRIPYGETLTEQKLGQVERAEDVLHRAGFSDCRVRRHGQLARIELPQEQLQTFWPQAGPVVEELKKLGFLYITLDLEGYRTGSLNETLEANHG